jgi:hypothetical protein
MKIFCIEPNRVNQKNGKRHIIRIPFVEKSSKKKKELEARENLLIVIKVIHAYYIR